MPSSSSTLTVDVEDKSVDQQVIAEGDLSPTLTVDVEDKSVDQQVIAEDDPSPTLTVDVEENSVDQQVISEDDLPRCLRKDDDSAPNCFRPSGKETLDPCATSIHHAGVGLCLASSSHQPAKAYAHARVRGDVGAWEKTGLFDGLHGITITAPANKKNAGRKNAYNSREQKLNATLHTLADEGMVRLSEGTQGIAGKRFTIAVIYSTNWGEVIARLDASIKSSGKKYGTPSENLTQCLRDLGV
eukprot:605639-Rhodomonas_salina.1